jgi:hypothetical protein
LTWEPKLAAVDVRRIVPNLVDFCNDRKDEARAWAGLETSDEWTLYQTAESRIKTDFPHTGIVRRRVTSDSKDDGYHVRLELTFETEVSAEHTKEGRTEALAQLQYDSDSHSLALESMILNIPATTLYTDVPGRRGDYRQVTTNDPLEVAVSETRSMFNVQQLAVFQFIVGQFG